MLPKTRPAFPGAAAVLQLFLDEMPVTSDMLTSIPVNDIAYIKVFSPPFMGATGGGSGGGIAIYTRKGGDENRNPVRGFQIIPLAVTRR